jgi:hypothetical protein
MRNALSCAASRFLVVVQFRKTYHGGTETRMNGEELKATVAAEEPRNAQIECKAFKNSP